MAKIKYNPKPGDKYGKYTIVSQVYHNSEHERVVDCKCECGSKRTALISQLKILKECQGCRGKNTRKFDVGTKIGSLLVIEYFNCPIKNKNFVKVKCDCNKIYTIHACSLCRTRTCQDCLRKISGSKHRAYKGLEFISQVYYTNIKNHANRKKRKFTITIEYINNLLIKQNHKCALSGLPIKIGNKKIETTASLDRIDSTKGYIEGNVQWVHKHINKMKQEFSDSYFIDICKKIAENNK